MRKRLVLSIIILCSACKAAPKDKWIEAFEPAATDALCVPQQFFRQCFELDEQACKQGMGAQIHQCLTEVKSQIPDRMSKDDGEKFGRMIGECAGSRYEVELSAQAKRRDNPKCSDPTAWVNP